jgi:hypothetical protein
MYGQCKHPLILFISHKKEVSTMFEANTIDTLKFCYRNLTFIELLRRLGFFLSISVRVP